MTAGGVAPSVLALPDGRTLGWYEFGDRDGVPCLLHPGAATSGVAGRAFDAAARSAGVRFIAIHRPGLGHSDPAPHRRLSDWAADVGALADDEGIGRFAVLGHSGGGSHALALAHGLPDRAVLTVVAAGLGPYEEPWLRRLLDARTRRYYWLIRHAEPVFRAMFALGFSDDLDTLAAKTAAVDPSTPDGRFYRRDPTTTRKLLAGNTAAARRGVRWPVQDLRVPLLP